MMNSTQLHYATDTTLGLHCIHKPCWWHQARSTAVLSGAAESPPPPACRCVWGGGESEEGLSGPATFLPKIRPKILGFTLGFINVSMTVHIN